MNIALAQSEVSHFLQCPKAKVNALWSTAQLERTIYVDYRAHEELSHSSVFDVLQYYLQSEVLPSNADPAQIDAWLAAVDEFTEIGDWERHSFDDLAFMLMQIYLDFAPPYDDATKLARQATQILGAYFCLLSFVDPTPRAA